MGKIKHPWWHWFFVITKTKWTYIKGYGGGLTDINYCTRCKILFDEVGDIL
jgi:hypothetical protein